MSTATMTKPDDKFEHAKSNAAGWLSSIEDMLEAFGKASNELDECRIGGNEKRYEEARQAIEESVLSVQVRDGWRAPGSGGQDRESYSEDGPEEYEILLSTGGPALRIIGRLDQYCQPKSAEMQMQDWGTPWTRYPAPEATLLAFASVFWFGE